jgi:methionyl-tRNA formyltransferase
MEGNNNIIIILLLLLVLFNLIFYKFFDSLFKMKKISNISNSNFDIGVVVSFGYFLTPSILESFTKGAVNVHPSLLPK